MALLPPVEDPTPVECHRSIPAPFITKTYQLVEDQSIDHVISWNEDGSTFILWNPAFFIRDFLPRFFKHSHFSVFFRLLYIYGFRKVASDRWEFSNEFFRRGEKQLLCQIQRREIASSRTVPAAVSNATANLGEKMVISASCSHSCAERADRETENCWHNKIKIHDLKSAWPILTESSGNNRRSYSSSDSDDYSGPSLCKYQPSAESDSNRRSLLHIKNEMLRKENLKLSKELEETKSLCNNLLTLYANINNQADCGGSKSMA